MNFIPSQNLDATKAAVGEQSPGVLALQKSLNALGAGIKEDSQYGPLTQAAYVKYGTSLGKTGVVPPAPAPVAPAAPAVSAPAPAAAPVVAPAPAPVAPVAPVAPSTITVSPTVTPAPPAPALTLTGDLQPGSKGSEVSTLQGLLGIKADGNFGPMTSASVKAFQAANGLPVDGIVGPQTLAALNKAHSGPSATDNVNGGINNGSGGGGSPADASGQPKIPLTGNSTVDTLISYLNNQSPQQSFTDIYKEAYNSLGIPDLKATYAAQTAAYTALQNEKQDKIDEINNNPWYSEGVRVNKLKELDNSYSARETNLTNKLKLTETNITSANSNAQFLAGKVMDQLNQSSKLTDDIITKAIDVAQKQADAEKPISVGENSKLVDPKTGRVIAYGNGTSGGGSPSVVSTVGGGNIVAGVKVDPTISSDLLAVLEGRNTLYNIRQTMGRTNSAAAYMQKMRDTIAKIDPKFDFIASDAGGKFISSSYYQKATSAINSVLPNIDKIVDLSNQVGRVGVKGVDAILQKGAIQIGNQKVSNFQEAQKLIADEIGIALGAGNVSDMKLQLGFDVTDPSVKPEVFASNMGVVKEFIQNRLSGLNQLRYSSSTLGGGSSSSPSKFDYLIPNITLDNNTKSAYLPRNLWDQVSGADKDALLAEVKGDGYNLLIK